MKPWIAGVGMLVLATAAQAGGGGMTGLQQNVAVESRDGRVWVTMTAENAGAKPVYLPNAAYKSDRLFGRTFEVRNRDSGVELDYTGPMVKRGPLTVADFTELKPGGKISHAIDITPSFAFSPGKHNYQLSYEGKVVADPANLAAPGPTQKFLVTFTHIGK
jgi:hypothetical protein